MPIRSVKTLYISILVWAIRIDIVNSDTAGQRPASIHTCCKFTAAIAPMRARKDRLTSTAYQIAAKPIKNQVCCAYNYLEPATCEPRWVFLCLHTPTFK
jgi:hypothetical protein